MGFFTHMWAHLSYPLPRQLNAQKLSWARQLKYLKPKTIWSHATCHPSREVDFLVNKLGLLISKYERMMQNRERTSFFTQPKESPTLPSLFSSIFGYYFLSFLGILEQPCKSLPKTNKNLILTKHKGQKRPLCIIFSIVSSAATKTLFFFSPTLIFSHF